MNFFFNITNGTIYFLVTFSQVQCVNSQLNSFSIYISYRTVETQSYYLFIYIIHTYYNI